MGYLFNRGGRAPPPPPGQVRRCGKSRWRGKAWYEVDWWAWAMRALIGRGEAGGDFALGLGASEADDPAPVRGCFKIASKIGCRGSSSSHSRERFNCSLCFHQRPVDAASAAQRCGTDVARRSLTSPRLRGVLAQRVALRCPRS